MDWEGPPHFPPRAQGDPILSVQTLQEHHDTGPCPQLSAHSGLDVTVTSAQGQWWTGTWSPAILKMTLYVARQTQSKPSSRCPGVSTLTTSCVGEDGDGHPLREAQARLPLRVEHSRLVPQRKVVTATLGPWSSASHRLNCFLKGKKVHNSFY